MEEKAKVLKHFEAIGPEIWGAEFDLWINGLIHFRGRMTVVRLEDGGLWLHSPIPIDDEMAASLATLGEVKWLVAPNCFHHVHLLKVKARYPEAKIFGVAGLQTKRKDIPFDAILGPEAPDAWKGQIEQKALEGMPSLQEMVFFHKASQSLIVTDMVFHVYEAKGFFAPLLFRLVGAYRKLAMSRAGKRMIKDRLAFQASLQAILAFPFDRLIMAHGRIIPTQAKPALQSALASLL